VSKRSVFIHCRPAGSTARCRGFLGARRGRGGRTGAGAPRSPVPAPPTPSTRSARHVGWVARRAPRSPSAPTLQAPQKKDARPEVGGRDAREHHGAAPRRAYEHVFGGRGPRRRRRAAPGGRKGRPRLLAPRVNLGSVGVRPRCGCGDGTNRTGRDGRQAATRRGAGGGKGGRAARTRRGSWGNSGVIRRVPCAAPPPAPAGRGSRSSRLQPPPRFQN
jgi:hypothetical protein